MNQQLSSKITHKLAKLHQLLDRFNEVRKIDPADSNTWDSNILTNLVEDLQETLQLLADKRSYPLQLSYAGGAETIQEFGLGSLIAKYHSEAETQAT